MAGEERRRSEGKGRPAFDKTGSVPRLGSIGLVLFVALLLIAAAAGVVYIGEQYSGLYILALLALQPSFHSGAQHRQNRDIDNRHRPKVPCTGLPLSRLCRAHG